MSPVKAGSAAATSAAVTVTGDSASVWPEVSCVSVTRPSRSVATYSFSPLSAKETARVACPTNTGSTPVAMGSSVPAWPTFLVFRMPRSLAQTSMLVQSAGLSMMMIPLAMGTPFGFIKGEFRSPERPTFANSGKSRQKRQKEPPVPSLPGALYAV